MSMTVSEAKAEDKGPVDRLLQLCLHDYSSYDPFPIGDDGLFSYQWGNAYWTDPSRHVYVFRFHEKLAGFAFIRARDSKLLDWDWQMAEFFILGACRRKGIGTAIAIGLLQAKPGVWAISYDVANLPARTFWRRIALTFDADAHPKSAGAGRERYLVLVKREGANQQSLQPTAPSCRGRA